MSNRVAPCAAGELIRSATERRIVTEAEWLACDSPEAIEAFDKREFSKRKIRLLGCACLRFLWADCGKDAPGIVEVVERYADGAAPSAALRRARDEWATGGERLESADACGRPMWTVYHLTGLLASDKQFGQILFEMSAAFSDHWIYEELDWSTLCNFQRDIFGNPFRPVTFSPAWRTETALSLARRMYEARDFSAMPLLADALQDAGCDNADILDHCRDPDATHVRGCWVVDLVLGKE
jgi:hypothetical protein